MQILKVFYSPLKNKRLRVLLDDNKTFFDFGLKNSDGTYGNTYIDHKNKKKRFNYWARHYNNEIEKKLIDNLILSPSMLSAYILWGKYKTIYKNVLWLNKKLQMKNE
jgi:hypothetical protein